MPLKEGKWEVATVKGGREKVAGETEETKKSWQPSLQEGLAGRVHHPTTFVGEGVSVGRIKVRVNMGKLINISAKVQENSHQSSLAGEVEEEGFERDQESQSPDNHERMPVKHGPHALFPMLAFGATCLGCQLPDAILHGKRSYRPRSRAVQHLSATGLSSEAFQLASAGGCATGLRTW
jgi:hypothetical protein